MTAVHFPTSKVGAFALGKGVHIKSFGNEDVQIKPQVDDEVLF